MSGFLKSVAAVVCALLVLQAVPARAEEDTVVKSRTRLDTARGYIAGLNADYSFNLPHDASARQIIIDRVILRDATMALERLDFFVAPVTAGPEPAPLLSLYVFTNYQWNDMYRLKRVLKSRDYVFAAYFEDKNPFTDLADRTAYTYVKYLLGDVDRLKRLIVLPPNQTSLYEFTLFLNGEPLTDPIIERGGTYYIPLRRLCEAMGYGVTWMAPKRTVYVIKGTFRYSFAISGTVYWGKGYVVSLIGGRCYASSGFFTRVLKKNLEIDEWGNVYVFDK
ncbi:MAG: copper amine oxidase N-terminal domain-containing protein [Clostridiales bacterium]|jgi:hypothetical protein|nr:copper amine oxidase N-terminal domain-containing protein [Clostridiales bacterium]